MFQEFSWPREKGELYPLLKAQAAALLEGEPDPVANMANLSALLWQALPEINWVGFYRTVGEELVLGPFQGKPACVRIPWGKGVCGAAAKEKVPQLVPDVHAFPGHIACDGASRSELVIPLLAQNGEVTGVLDLDSQVSGRFTGEDLEGLLPIARLAAEALFPQKEGDGPEWAVDSALHHMTSGTPARELFQAVCDEIGRYYQPAGLKYTRSNRKLRWKGKRLCCEIGFWSSHSNRSGEWVNLEIVPSVFVLGDGMVRKGLLPLNIRPKNFNVCRPDKDCFAEIIAWIDRQLALARSLESREGVERYLKRLPDRQRETLGRDDNLRRYLDRLDKERVK